MSPLIYTPTTAQPHLCPCQPPMWMAGYAEVTEPMYPVDSIWACDECGQRWIVVGETYGAPTIAGQIEGKTYERKYWAHHDKDTP